jgi:hypothetical protein
MLATLQLYPLDGDLSITVREKLGEMKEPIKGRKRLGIVFRCQPGQIYFQVGAPRSIARGSDEAQALAGHEEAMREFSRCRCSFYLPHRR